MFWFYHEYLDEARRFRIHRIQTETEQEARKLHRHACAFQWVTHHVEPSVSSLLERGDSGPRTIAPSHRPGDTYHTDYRWAPMPEHVREAIRTLGAGREAALSGVRGADDRNPVLDPPGTPRKATKQDGFDTPF
jgi:hypothetical protein